MPQSSITSTQLDAIHSLCQGNHSQPQGWVALLGFSPSPAPYKVFPTCAMLR